MRRLREGKDLGGQPTAGNDKHIPDSIKAMLSKPPQPDRERVDQALKMNRALY